MQAYPLASDVMIKELQYKGYATEPSDYECPDGQLATSLNLINEDSQLKPVFQPKTLFEVKKGYEVVGVHKTNGKVHYIVYAKEEQMLGYISDDDAAKTVVEIEELGGDMRLLKVECIGNTLVALTGGGVRYYLFKAGEDGAYGQYQVLGEKPAAIEVTYDVKPIDVMKEGGDPDGDIFGSRTDLIYLTGEAAEASKLYIDSGIVKGFATKILAKIAEMKGWAKELHAFWNPFFIRLAYRTYTGSHIMHTAPMLVCPNSQGKPFVLITWHRAAMHYSEGNKLYGQVYLPSVAVGLKVSAIPEAWRDIITGIDIFISPQIQAYADDDGAFDLAERVYGVEDDSIIAFDDWRRYTNDERDFVKSIVINFGSLENLDERWVYTLNLKHAKGKTCAELVAEESRFYLFRTLMADDLTDGQTHYELSLSPDNDDYDNLQAKERLDDDYMSRDTIVAKASYVYNSRLHLAPTVRRAGAPDALEGFMPQRDAVKVGEDAIMALQVEIQTEGQTGVTMVSMHVSGWDGNELFRPKDLYWFYYPDVNATALRIGVGTKDAEGEIGISHWFRIPLMRHSMLNGAFAFNAFNTLPNTADSVQTEKDSRKITLRSKLYASELSNPFVFPTEGMNTVGTGEILGMSAAVKALSQGQYGQFPLYVFTTDGVWSLGVSETGSYTTKQPVTRDVCLSGGSITQTDDGVLFATARGIMELKGSQSSCMTDGIASEVPFDALAQLPLIEQLLEKLGADASGCLEVMPFRTFLAGCRMVYDYACQRLVVFNEECPTALVLSLRSGQWGMMRSNLKRVVPSYPEALAMTHDNKLVSFSETDEQVCKGLYITRPLKLEAADVQKTISTLIQRGHFQRGDVGTVLYGSRDLYKWYLIWSSKDHYLRGFRGTPYKYFRIAGLATLTDGKSIFGASVNFESRHTNQLR